MCSSAAVQGIQATVLVITDSKSVSLGIVGVGAQVNSLAESLQVNGVLELGDKTSGTNKYAAIDKWACQLRNIHNVVVNKLPW